MSVIELPLVTSRLSSIVATSVVLDPREERDAMSQASFARRDLTVGLENGLHMAPCAAVVKAVQEFGGSVRVLRDSLVVDASSVFELLGLGAQCGTVLTIEAEGNGAEGLLDRLEQVFQKDSDGRR